MIAGWMDKLVNIGICRRHTSLTRTLRLHHKHSQAPFLCRFPVGRRLTHTQWLRGRYHHSPSLHRSSQRTEMVGWCKSWVVRSPVHTLPGWSCTPESIGIRQQRRSLTRTPHSHCRKHLEPSGHIAAALRLLCSCWLDTPRSCQTMWCRLRWLVGRCISLLCKHYSWFQQGRGRLQRTQHPSSVSVSTHWVIEIEFHCNYCVVTCQSWDEEDEVLSRWFVEGGRGMTIRSNSNPSYTNETAWKRRSNTNMNILPCCQGFPGEEFHVRIFRCIPHLFSTTHK